MTVLDEWAWCWSQRCDWISDNDWSMGSVTASSQLSAGLILWPGAGPKCCPQAKSGPADTFCSSVRWTTPVGIRCSWWKHLWSENSTALSAFKRSRVVGMLMCLECFVVLFCIFGLNRRCCSQWPGHFWLDSKCTITPCEEFVLVFLPVRYKTMQQFIGEHCVLWRNDPFVANKSFKLLCFISEDWKNTLFSQKTRDWRHHQICVFQFVYLITMDAHYIQYFYNK